jgi:hypothetical protein
MEKSNTPSVFKVGQIWRDDDMDESANLFLVVGVFETGLYIKWLHTDLVHYHSYVTCAYDTYIRDISSLEKELL